MAKRNVKKVFITKEKKIMVTILATVGVVAVWRGIWLAFDSIPFFNDPLVAGALSIIVLVVAALYFKRINFF
jgi:hypothetical protein